MKTSLLALFTFNLFFLLLAVPAPAQTRAALPALPGYWNLETNLVTRDYTIVRFYNDRQELLYEERLTGLCLDLSRGNGLCQRTARQLNGALAQVLRTPEAAAQTMGALAQQLGQSRRVQRVYAVR
ncbi:hypothetical protein [Hymenobacter chitinivorans]|uniref:Lipocalin-like protein n=1 Tax=Hymenobacter chitinivorans DSM 11115 TaxID=1121954 RepID=A0A2M9BSN2_9BACT|nr:hypothetical protein [Hymenobacter chitinivorans]PJJ60958.1 hypothetical protein CLV45_2395 [Hymenobacter chitinivorans DSM 11115]